MLCTDRHRERLQQCAAIADIMMRREQQTGALALEPPGDGRDFFRCGLLAGLQVVETEHQDRVAIGQDAFVNGKPEPRLINALEYRDGLAGHLARQLLEIES